ncbi:MAG: hypothetical protein M3004_01245 [Bacteroidota bacterium]|nr:hypothetical protein [Bacteroidota bacterium]
MFKKILPVALVITILFSCSRKHTPEKAIAETPVNVPTKSDSVVVKKRNFTPTKKDIIPNSIGVNDQAAHKSIDGRLYYDLLGHRYWKNYKNGKYYLFNQKMYDNPAFKPPKY